MTNNLDLPHLVQVCERSIKAQFICDTMVYYHHDKVADLGRATLEFRSTFTESTVLALLRRLTAAEDQLAKWKSGETHLSFAQTGPPTTHLLSAQPITPHQVEVGQGVAKRHGLLDKEGPMTPSDSLEKLLIQLQTIPLSERIEKSRSIIGKLCSEGRSPRMTIPVQYSDEDFFISQTLAECAELLSDRDRLAERCKELEAYITEFVDAVDAAEHEGLSSKHLIDWQSEIWERRIKYVYEKHK